MRTLLDKWKAAMTSRNESVNHFCQAWDQTKTSIYIIMMVFEYCVFAGHQQFLSDVSQKSCGQY